MTNRNRSRWICRHGAAASSLIGLLGLVFCLVGCNSGGSSGSIAPQSSTNPQLEQEAAQELLKAYQTALLQEDIDRLQTLLHDDGGSTEGRSFRETMTETFRRFNVTGIETTEVSIQSAANPVTVSFREALSMEDPIGRLQRTRSVRTTWRLVKQSSAGGAVTILIGAVTRSGPEVEVITRGLPHAGVPSRIEVKETTGTFALTGVEVEVPETGGRTLLAVGAGRFQGSFIPTAFAHPQALRLRLRSSTGEQVLVSHRYTVRGPGDGDMERVADTGARRFFAVATGHDGTAWFGGESDRSRTAGILVQVSADGRVILRQEQPFLSQLPTEAVSRVEALALDDLGRVHALFIARVGTRGTLFDAGVVANGVLVQDLQYPDRLCQTMNVFARDPQTGAIQFDPTYPFRMNDQPSPSTRVVAAGGQDVYLFGSDGGVARVLDGYRNGECPQDRVEVRYDPIFRRGESGLLSNTVPALTVATDGALWFGTAFGLTRLQNGQFTPIPFDPKLSLRGNAATLEAFYREVAQAIFEARPVSTVQIGGVSFLNSFGAPLLKEDLIFSLAQDVQGRLWVGTLGAGIRRIEIRGGSVQETLHLTRQQGLVSNNIFALGAGPDGTIWATSEEGVSRIQEVGGEPVITNFTALDGLGLPVRDVAVGSNGAVWLATDGGMFQMRTAMGVLRGVVWDTAGRPVVGADVRIPGTGFWTVTDAEGRFVLVNLPPGAQQLLIDGSVAVGGPYTAKVVQVTITAAEQVLQEPMTVTPRPPVARLAAISGDGQTGAVGRPLPQPLVVVVQDGAGHGIAGLAVTFMVTQGSGMFESEAVISDGGGRAANTLIPTAAGALQVTASIDGLEAHFTGRGFGELRDDGEIRPRLIQVSGNNQSGQPGEALPEPLVVRLEDQFGNPLPGQAVTAEITQGSGTLTPVACQNGSASGGTATTDQLGEACFRLQLGAASEDDLIVQVSARGQQVKFLAIVGTVDTLDAPRDLAVAGNIVYIADRFSGLRVIDVSDPTHPRQLEPQDLEGTEERLALSGNRLYLGTDFPPRLYIIDITNPAIPLKIQSVDLPLEVKNHGTKGLAIQGGIAYMVTDDQTAGSGTLQLVDVSDPTKARVVGTFSPLADSPAGLAVSGRFAYVSTGSAGLLIFDVGNPAHPVQVGIVEGVFLSSIVVAADFAYVVERQQDVNRFTVLDLHNPANPQRRGTASIPEVRQLDTRFPISIAGRTAYLVEFARGLEAVDINNPDRPLPVGRIDTPSETLNARATDDFIYVTDLVFGLQVIRGPGSNPIDTDGDGVIDFFDAFPHDPTESMDTDGDGIGDNADPDEDNDGFTDNEELQANPPSDPKDPRIFPVRLPPPNTLTLIVDAASPLSPRERNGMPAAPYRSITEALRAVRILRENGVPVRTVLVHPGKYTPLTTGEIFPLDLFNLPGLTLSGAGWETTVVDAQFTDDVVSMIRTSEIVIEGFTLTHGAYGIFINRLTGLTIRRNLISENAFSGIEMGINSSIGHAITENIIGRNAMFGVHLFENAAAKIINNAIVQNGSDGIFVVTHSTADISSNTISMNGDEGIQVQDNSKATIVSNIIEQNVDVGIFVVTESSAEVTLNNIIQNGNHGIQVQGTSRTIVKNNIVDGNSAIGILVANSSVGEITKNTIARNKLRGIQIQNTSQAMIIDNNIHENIRSGIFIFTNSAATVNNNIITNNSLDGIQIRDQSLANIGGGAITGNAANGVFLLEASTATIGVAGEILIIAHNSGAGIRVATDGSLAQINRDWIVFEDNGAGDIIGPITDLQSSSIALAVESNGGLVMVDAGSHAVVWVDPATGHRAFMSSAGLGGGLSFDIPVGIAVGAEGMPVVVDAGLAAVVRVDPFTGNRTLVSDVTRGRGNPFEVPVAIAIEGDGTFVVADTGLAALIRVDAVTGNRTVVSDAALGSGLRFEVPVAVAVEHEGSFVVVDIALAAVVRVDTRRGSRTMVSDTSLGQGPSLQTPVGIAVERTGTLIVVDAGRHALIRVDPNTGDRTLISGDTMGNGPPFSNPRGVVVEPDGSLVVVDVVSGTQTLVRVNPHTGNRAIVSK